MVEDEKRGHAATVDDSVVSERPSTGTAETVAGHGGALPSDARDGREQLRAGATIGRYEIVKVLGQGGMGIVYLAYDPTLDRPVALKLLRRELRSAQARLLREGQSVAKLAHPNVVRVFDVGTDHDDLFIAMEYVDGWTLGRWLEAEPRRSRAIFELFAAAGRGLAAAHGAGLVHRDFKPDNVLVGRDGRVVVTDFGLARLDADADAPAAASPAPMAAAQWTAITLTRTGSLLGTPAYMSPEQLRGEVADARSDQFAFCVAHWEALFGKRPFDIPARASFEEVRAAVERGIGDLDPPPPKALASAERVLRRGLSFDPSDRFPDIDALLDALDPGRSRDALIELAAIGDKIAHFRVVERIGQGGMGIVYRAYDEQLSRDVALKVLPSDVVARADRRERFLREARAAAAVVHPAIATVFEVGADDDAPYIAMEYVAGRTLRQMLTAGPFAVSDLIRIAIPIADALARAHRAGVVHRDLKPENVMIDAEGAPKILDFGLARLFDTGAVAADGAGAAIVSVVTEEGTILGTPAYMSPEQARGLPVDHRSDLFSFGTMLYELLTAQAPFRGASTLDIATAIIRDAPSTPSTLAVGTPLELDRIVLKCLEKDPDDRYQSAAELVVDLRRLLRQTESGIAISTSGIAPRRRRRRWIVPAIVGALATTATAVAIVSTFGTTESAVHRPSSAAAPLQLAVKPGRKLTSTPIRGRSDASLSPDGTQIAILRDGRLTLQNVSDGAARDLSPPSGRPVWLDWFPDGKYLLLGMATATPHSALYSLDVATSSSQKLGASAWGARVAHNGQQLATFDEGGLRVSDLDGTHDRLLVGTREEAEFSWPTWSPDDRWIAYGIRGPGIVPAIRAVAVDGSTDVLVVQDPQLASPSSLPDYVWLHDGRILFRTSTAEGSSLAIVDVELTTGRPHAAPIPIASFPDLIILNGTSNDGRLLYSRVTIVRSTMRGDLTATFEPKPVGQEGRRFVGRSRDRKTTYYAADSGVDRTELLAVGADDHVEALASFAGSPISPQLTQDESTIGFLYVDPSTKRISLRAVPTRGGDPRVVETLPYAPTVPSDFTEELVVQLACARRAARCVLGAMESGEQVFYDVDFAHGRGRRLAALRGPAPWRWDLSPDGNRVLVANQRDKDVVQILDLASGEAHEAFRQPDTVVFGVVWLDDSRAFLVTIAQYANALLVRVDPEGHQKTVWSTSTTAFGRLRVLDDPAPTLYFDTSLRSKDYWLLELPRPTANLPF